MNLPSRAFLALSAAASAPAARARHVFRALQEAGDGDGGLAIVSGTGVEEAAELPPGVVSTITVPEYSSGECDGWLNGVLAADADDSGGLNATEFHQFLVNVQDPPFKDNFFDQHDSYVNLPWMFKVIHKSLACRCRDLGGGDGCCKGDNAEIPFAGFTDSSRAGMTKAQLRTAAEYKKDMCNSVAAVFEDVTPEAVASPTSPTSPVTTVAKPEPEEKPAEPEVATPTVTTATVGPTNLFEEGVTIDVHGSVVDYSKFDHSKILYGTNEGVPEFYNAEDIQSNKDENGALGDVIKGFGALANKVLGGLDASGASEKGKRRLRASSAMAGRALQTPKMGILRPVVVTDIACFDGLAYAPKGAYCLNFKFTVNPDAEDPPNQETVSTFTSALTTAINDGGLYDEVISQNPGTAIKGLGSPGKGTDYINAAAPTKTELATSNEAADASSDGGGLGGAALAFIIIAVVVIPIVILAMYARYKKQQDKERLERLAAYNARHDLEGGPVGRSAPKMAPVEDNEASSIYSEDRDSAAVATKSATAGSSLAAMGAAGAAAAAALAGSKKPEGDVDPAIRKEVTTLVSEVSAPKTSDELLAAYSGREEELLAHLRTMKAKQSAKSEIDSLVASTKPGKTSDELLAAYSGREDELLRNLRKMETKQAIKGEIETLVASVKPGKTADELLAAYSGREDELKRNLEKMQSKQEVWGEIETLVASTKPGKTTDELLAAYSGREEELKKNLVRMQSSQESKREIKAEIESLVQETQPGKTADELLASFEGREEELKKNLKRMQSSQESKREIKAEIESLVEIIQPPKTSDELLRSYAGREKELLANLKKMKSKKDMKTVNSLVASVQPGKTSKELLAAFSGREDELIKHLKRMESKKMQKSVRNLVESVNPGKSSEELLAAYSGREDELIKHLKRMESKKTKAEVKALVESTNPGKSARELLEAYEGKEDELVNHMRKLQLKQTQQSVRSLVDDVNPGKTADELLSAFKGREDELKMNLEKMKAKKEKKAAKSAKAAQTDTASSPPPLSAASAAAPVAPPDLSQSVRSLVMETNPGKTADELLTAYSGREQQLVNHLEKLKASQAKKSKRSIA